MIIFLFISSNHLRRLEKGTLTQTKGSLSQPPYEADKFAAGDELIAQPGLYPCKRILLAATTTTTPGRRRSPSQNYSSCFRAQQYLNIVKTRRPEQVGRITSPGGISAHGEKGGQCPTQAARPCSRQQKRQPAPRTQQQPAILKTGNQCSVQPCILGKGKINYLISRLFPELGKLL